MLSNYDAREESCESLPWTARRSNQSILKEISPEYSLKGLMLKLQYFGYVMQSADSLEKTLMLGKTEGRRRRGQQRMRWLYSINSMDMNLSKLEGTLKDRGAWRATVYGVTKSQTGLSKRITSCNKLATWDSDRCRFVATISFFCKKGQMVLW